MFAAYRVLAHLGHRLPVPASLREGLAARRDAAERWIAWARAERGGGPLVWAHAASVGEQQALAPVLARLLRARPDLQLVLTHTSPSVSPTRCPAAVCQRDFLPWDEARPIADTLDALRPAVLLFGRGDLWPELVRTAAARGIPIAIAGATVRTRSARLWPVVRHVLGGLYRYVSWVGAVTPGDAERWAHLGVPAARITVTGDPRHDHILERVADVGPGAAVRRWAGNAPVLIAGSVEPSDDAVLAAALGRLATHLPALRAVLVPHDVTDGRVAALRAALVERELDVAVWSDHAGTAPPPAGVLIAAMRGMLADLYLGADIAYVGGGFRNGRLHAVAEPAAVGLPIIVGPRWADAIDCPPMVATGGAVPVAGRSGQALAATLHRLAGNRTERTKQGLAARAILKGGATQVTVDAVAAVLGPASRRE